MATADIASLTLPTHVSGWSNDLVVFSGKDRRFGLFIRNEDAADSVWLTFDGQPAATNAGLKLATSEYITGALMAHEVMAISDGTNSTVAVTLIPTR
jgi:hypothetical protein